MTLMTMFIIQSTSKKKKWISSLKKIGSLGTSMFSLMKWFTVLQTRSQQLERESRFGLKWKAIRLRLLILKHLTRKEFFTSTMWTCYAQTNKRLASDDYESIIILFITNLHSAFQQSACLASLQYLETRTPKTSPKYHLLTRVGPLPAWA